MTDQKQQAIAPEASVLGRLTEFGLTEPWHVALLLPSAFEDLRCIEVDGTNLEEGRAMILSGQVRGQPVTRSTGGLARLHVMLALLDGTVVEVTWFGNIKPIATQVRQGAHIFVKGEARLFQDRWQLSNPRLVESRWRGRCMPHYPGSGKRMSSETLRNRIVGLLRENLGTASTKCEAMLGELACPQEVLEAIHAPAEAESFERLLVRAHCPFDPETGRAAVDALHRFAATVMLKELILSRDRDQNARPALALNLSARMRQWKFAPSASQRSAMQKMSSIFSAPYNARALLSGEVGSGKTAVFLTLAAAVIDAGGRVAVLLPNEQLCRQCQKVMAEFFPDIASALVISDTKESGAEQSIAFGTTALLSRNPGAFDLVITDEQQKLGAEQRRQLRGPQTHQLDVTATAIPRTMALAAFGMIETIQLREGHAQKSIRTHLWNKDQQRELFTAVRKTVASGARTLVIYPAIEKGEGAKAVRSIEEAVIKWEKQFPGMVRTIHGRIKGEEKQAALEDLISGAASIGICTTAVEVGINIPNMRRVVVVHPERFGLTTLHQIRGRLAREGGDGDFDMALMGDLGDDSITRLKLLEEHNDGFALAEADMRTRGPGELGSTGTRQSGGAESILFKHELQPELLAEMEPTVNAWFSRLQNP